MAQSTYAVQINSYGPPDVMRWTETALAPLARNDIRIKTIAAAVNHTDLEIRAGNWPIGKPEPFPYVPGVEVIGDVEAIGSAVTGITPGQRVITMMQGLGGVRAERAGGYAAHVTVAAEAVAVVAREIDPYVLAALGLGAVTAFGGLSCMGALVGKRIMVTGAAGGVGSAAVALARAQGASVVGLVSREEQVAYVLGLGADDVAVTRSHASADASLRAVDGVLDTVGAPVFPVALAALKPGGIFSLVGAVGGGAVNVDLWELLRPVTLTGYSTEQLTGTDLRQAVAALVQGLRNKTIAAPAWTSLSLREAARAHELLERKGVSGRVLLVP